MRYGFVGLGNLGRHLAINLARSGFDVGVHDLQRGAADPVLAAGARWVGSMPELAAASDCLITCGG
jgi:3-hydroxyisobutyrate dehydrogenase